MLKRKTIAQDRLSNGDLLNCSLVYSDENGGYAYIAYVLPNQAGELPIKLYHGGSKESALEAYERELSADVCEVRE